MSNFAIATRYTQAFFEAAKSENKLDIVYNDIKFVFNTINLSKELRSLLRNPILKQQKKIDILNALFSERINSTTLSFIQFVIKKNRQDILFDIVKRFLSKLDDEFNFQRVIVTAAIDLDEISKKNLEAKLSALSKKEIIAEYKVDKNLIGGFTAEYNDTMLDASVKHQLDMLKQKFSEDSSLLN